MIAEPLVLLSERPLEVPTRTGLGDRFRHFRGISGRKYLFTRIEADEVADFRSAVLIMARREPRGLRAVRVTEIDANGRITTAGWPPIVPRDGVLFIHLLAEQAAARSAAVEDLSRTVALLA